MKILKLIILSLLVCSHCYGQNSGNQSYNAQKAGRELCKWQKESKAKADSTRKGNGPNIPNGGQGKGGDNKGKKPQPAKKEIPKGKTICSACKGEGWYGQSKDKEEARRHPATFTDPCNYCNGKGYY